ncbi:ciliary neurotrophic factor receptor subunit alpha-like [Salvelinus alpinus]
MANTVTSLCCVVLAAVVVAYAQRRSQTGASIQYERMGGDVTMQCGSLDSEASVTWKVNGTDVKARHREEGSRLILMEVDLSNNGLYTCFQNPNGERRDQINLRIGTSPREPTVMCRSNTYPKGFYCSWHLQHPTSIPTDFDVNVQHNQKSLEATRDAVHKNRCHVKFLEVFSSYPYRVNVTAVNALGSASTAITFEEFNIVKPDPPEKVVATPIPNNVRRLEVTWNSPSTWPDVESFPLKYFLRYRPLIRDQWQHVSYRYRPLIRDQWQHVSYRYRPLIRDQWQHVSCRYRPLIRDQWQHTLPLPQPLPQQSPIGRASQWMMLPQLSSHPSSGSPAVCC